MESKNVKIPEYFQFPDFLRFFYEFDWDFDTSIIKIEEHLLWLKSLPSSRLSKEAKLILDTGIVYQLGRDKNYSPLIFIDFEKLDFIEGKNFRRFNLFRKFGISS